MAEKQDKMEIDEKEKSGEWKNVMEQDQKPRTKYNRKRQKKVRNCECSYLTKTCLLFRKLLTDREVDQIHELSARSLKEGWGSRQRRNFGKTGSKQSKYSAVKSGGHTVTFLEDKFARKLPCIFKFMNKVMLKIDHQTGWNILKSVKRYNPRRMEFLQYSSKKNPIIRKRRRIEKKLDDGLGWHFDTDSLLNLVCMCSYRDEYEGGLLQIKVKSKEGGSQILTVPKFDRGDAVIFLSEKTEHRVTPTTAGMRCTFVYELWDQEGYDEGTDSSSGCESYSDSSSISSS